MTPDVEAACGAMTDALVDRMAAEMTDQGWPGITDCPSLITTTAELYHAAGAEAAVEVSLREERAGSTSLFITYPGGKCGTVVMEPRASGWVMTEQSQQEC